MGFVETLKKQSFFENILKKKEAETLSNSIMYFCEDEVTSQKVLVMTALLLEYPTFDLFDEKSAQFLRIEEGVDIDVKVYPKNGDKLLVSDANEIVSEAFIKPVNLPYKIFLLKNFDVSTEEAQNKLLKVLEEPPRNVYFILSVKNEEKVLATIKSRCDKVKITPLSDEEMEAVCKDKLACVLGGGYIGKTLALEKNRDLASVVDFAVSLLTQLKNSKQVLSFSKKMLEEKTNLNLVLQVLSLCLEDIIKLKCESENLCKLKSYQSDLKDVEPEFSAQAICEISNLISKFREKLEFNANLTVAVDNFLLKMLEVKFLCK